MLEKHYGELPEGCKLCAKGQKLVLFTTGICPQNCIYCPLSPSKKNKDVTNFNECKSNKIKDLIKEVKLSGAKGAGITGGDPLAVLKRTIRYIRALKQNFGKKFHIHLYTSLALLSKENISRLEKAGLDEIRVHPNILDKSLWFKINLLKNTKMKNGIEIPALPKKEKEILELINFAKDKVEFFNINELEYAALKEKEYKSRNWQTTENYSIKNSEKTALNILEKAKSLKIRIHYCSASFKDNVQFSERLKNYAKNAAKEFDVVTKEGTLLHGAVCPKNSSPKSLLALKTSLEKEFKNKLFFIDKNKQRILCSPAIIRQVAKKFKNAAIVEEYPTRDQTEVYLEFLS
ncbi:radical SAM protein [Candidatus Pacearchaeota archaeon]|nr:radical SAM protein [Candidatus Pacearchaeota archaeon]